MEPIHFMLPSKPRTWQEPDIFMDDKCYSKREFFLSFGEGRSEEVGLQGQAL